LRTRDKSREQKAACCRSAGEPRGLRHPRTLLGSLSDRAGGLGITVGLGHHGQDVTKAGHPVYTIAQIAARRTRVSLLCGLTVRGLKLPLDARAVSRTIASDRRADAQKHHVQTSRSRRTQSNSGISSRIIELSSLPNVGDSCRRRSNRSP
jgi:hypothetical protein